MGKELIIRLIVGILGEYLISPKTAAKYAKYLIRSRDYLNLLFPLDKYPEGDYKGTTFEGVDKEKLAVPVSLVNL